MTELLQAAQIAATPADPTLNTLLNEVRASGARLAGHDVDFEMLRNKLGQLNVTAGCGWRDCFAPFVAAFARARPCCSGLRASLCCPAWQLLLSLRFVNPNKDTIIIIIISTVNDMGQPRRPLHLNSTCLFRHTLSFTVTMTIWESNTSLASTCTSCQSTQLQRLLPLR